MDLDEKLHRSQVFDVKQSIPFWCVIGDVEAKALLRIEPDPHGDDTGNEAHASVIILCNRTDPDTSPPRFVCTVNGRLCPFQLTSLK